MKVVFAGTPEFAARALAALLASKHHVAGVLTQPDRPAGRGLAPAASPVKVLAAAHGVPVLQPASLKSPEAAGALRALAPDVLLVAAYGLILPQAVLDLPRHGAINIHASLLPRWRGAAPIQRALLAGDGQTGISIMRMDAGLDTGPVLLREAFAVTPEDTAGSLHDKLAECGARLAMQALDLLQAGTARPEPQDPGRATYAAKIGKDEARIDWRESAEAVCRRVRAFDPVPGARSRIRAAEIKLWGASVEAGSAAPGEILAAGADGVVVACGEAAVRIRELQRPGAKRLTAAAFLRGMPLAAGERFDAL